MPRENQPEGRSRGTPERPASAAAIAATRSRKRRAAYAMEMERAAGWVAEGGR